MSLSRSEELQNQNEQVVTFTLVELLTSLVFIAMILALVLRTEALKDLDPSRENMFRLKQQLEKLGPVTVSDARAGGLVLYRVRVGPVATVEQADGLLDKVSVTSPDARIVVN